MTEIWGMVRGSRYAAVNERRRKKRWNNRSTAQLARRHAERQADLNAAWTTERRGRRTRHGLVNTGYLASLMAEREAILAEARAQPVAVVVVQAHSRRGTRGVRRHVRRP